MPSLKNPRHEKFALALSEGKSASQAYIDAGYRPCRQNAARMTTFDDIQTRVSELQAAAAKSTEVTIESLLGELESARAKADSLGQLSASVKAISEKAKISGLLVQRIEVGEPNSFAECGTKAQLFDALFDRLATSRSVEVSEEDRDKFVGLLTQAFAVLDRCKVKPGAIVDGTASLRDIRALEHEQRKPRPPVRRLLNGS